MKKIFSALMILGFVSACAPGGGDDTKSQQIKDAKDKSEKIVPLHGTYEGTLTAYQTDHATGALKPIQIPLTIGIYSVLEKVGTDPKGEPVFMPMAKLRYRQQDIVRPDEVLAINYTPENGVIQASKASSQDKDKPAAATDIMTINATIEGATLRGEVIRNGKIGDFVVHRTNSEFIAPVSDVDDYMDRLDLQNRQVQGAYIGRVTEKQGPSGVQNFAARLDLRAERVIVNGVRIARLVGSYSRPDGIGARTFPDVSFTQNTLPPVLYMSVTGLPNGNFMNISGVVENGNFRGTIEDSVGSGKINLVKQVR